jgi:hypothetical protein
MKSFTLLLFLAAAVSGFGQSQSPVTVRVSTDVEELARGYAEAFPAITRTPVYLIHSRDDITTVLISIKSVKAAAGVLIVQDEKGLTYIINPKDVVMISDAPPPKKDR